MSAPLTRRRALAAVGALAGAAGLALAGRAAYRAADEAAYRAWAARMAGALRWLRSPYDRWFDVEPEGWDGWLSSAPDHPFPRLALTEDQRAWLAEAAATFDEDPREALDVDPAEAVGRLEHDLEAVVMADPSEDATLAFWAWGAHDAAWDAEAGFGLADRETGEGWDTNVMWFQYMMDPTTYPDYVPSSSLAAGR